MEFSSGTQHHTPDSNMTGVTFTNEMLTSNFFSNSSQDGSGISLTTTSFASDDIITIESQKADFQSILDIFQQYIKIKDHDSEIDDEGNELKTADYQDGIHRIEQLRSICPALDRLLRSGSNLITEAAETLADGSRDPRWRIPIGASGILNSFLEIMASARVPQQLMIHVLRLIGNSSADTDENRERVITQGYLPSIISLLTKTDLLPFVIPVLYNICVDYEPAQRKASETQLTKNLVALISGPNFNDSGVLIGYICKLLDLMITQPSEIELAPENTPEVLFKLTYTPEWGGDLDDFLAIVSCGVAYLRHERFQKAVIRSSAVQTCTYIMILSYTRFDDINTDKETSIITESAGQDDTQRLSAMRNNLNQVLSDISALPEFASTFPILSQFASKLRHSLSTPQIQLQVMACIMLGNIARSDKACEEFVSTSQIHKPLISIITEAHNQQLLHAALGFLKNLALPLLNKPILGEAGIINILPRLWNMEALPQIQYSSISLTRHLLNGTFENIKRICNHLSDDQDSPAYHRTSLSILTSIFQRTDAEPIKVEIARLITAICRGFTSPLKNINNVEEQRKQFFQYHPEISRPLGFMISQNKWPVVRSEGWFVMALMARTPEGAKIIGKIMHDVQVFQPLVELLTGKSIIDGDILLPSRDDNSFRDVNNADLQTVKAVPPNNPSGTNTTKEVEMSRIDRENALVLVSELIRHQGSEMAPFRRSIFDDLLKGGGRMHMSYQQVKECEEFFDGTKI